ncbi:uncharacterized protein LOC128302914 [Anopheles moucheti]|uniref:uncharacterized protein LOC128302914 n=1 Tax=Anopheles moucheti TaxID=186751 RepID=UPI0022F086B4|nr:uncharacterized protein LOC128302914 [Anopheles moucheti]
MVQFIETGPFDYEEYFSIAAQFLYKYQWIFCYNNTKFIRCGVLEQLPREWITDLDTLSNEEFNHIPVGCIKDTWCDSFREFLLQVKMLQVQYDTHENIDQPHNRHKQKRKGINAKKAYEIDNLCSFIELEQFRKDATLFIDFGSGLGYLSELIHERYGAKVLGIEGNATLVQTCNNRSSVSTSKAVQYCHHYITDDSFGFIEQQCSDRFDNYPHRAAVVGLHACADLSITAINCFLHCKWATSLTIMPCCYHRMKPLDEKAPNEFQNFPLSQELRTILLEEQDEAVRVGKLGSTLEEITVENMLEQFKLLKQLECNTRECPWTDQHKDRMSALLQKYGPEGPKLAEYLECLQTCLQSICENVILLDRMCYMESEANRSSLKMRRKLVRLRDDGLSPRCFIFYASKDE